MNYAAHYQRLMDRAEGRTLIGYSERHHVVPRCMDKLSKHTVRLTPEEHYVAHQLLVKMHPDNSKLVFAVNQMTWSARNTPRNNKLFGWLRRRMAEAAGKSKHALGYKFTEQQLKNRREERELRIKSSDGPEVVAQKTVLIALRAEAKELERQIRLKASRERQNAALVASNAARKGQPLSEMHHANNAAAQHARKGVPTGPQRLSDAGRAAHVEMNKTRVWTAEMRAKASASAVAREAKKRTEVSLA